MFFSSKKILGLDLGSSSIKMAELNVTAGSAELVNFASLATPQHSIIQGEISDPVLVADALKFLHKSQKLDRKNVAIGLWGNSAIVKKISLPRRDPKELKDHIKFESQQYLPFDISQITLEHHILPFSMSADMMDVLIIAAQNDMIKKYLEVAKLAHLDFKILDVSSIALSNIFEFNYGKQNLPIALFNFGAHSTQFLVVLQGEIIFSRDIPVGGYQFTSEISKNMGITFEEAESLKMSLNRVQEVPEETRVYVNQAVEMVAEEIRNSIDFYSASSGELQIAKAYYTGGASLTPGLIPTLQDSLKIPFEVINPLLKIKTKNKKLTPQYLEQISPFLAISLGLGLRQIGDSV